MDEQKSQTNRETIMAMLSKLQEKYVVQPVYTTASAHIDKSKEGKLTRGGRALILTNSLAFDTEQATIIEILKNIDKGAEYNYYMPKSKNVVNDIARYLGVCMQEMHRIQTIPNKQEEIYNRIQFYLFDPRIYCSYNFALFEQDYAIESENFTQGWWYINPGSVTQSSDAYSVIPDGTMIANEIDNDIEIEYLTTCFDLLDKEPSTRKLAGKEGVDNINNLNSFVMGERK